MLGRAWARIEGCGERGREILVLGTLGGGRVKS